MSIPISLPLRGPILGIGVDIVSVGRIRELLERQGDRFIQRVYTEVEQEYCARYRQPYERYAARFAAKEAVAKAFTTGIGEYLDWRSIGVASGERGQPEIVLDAKGDALLKQFGGSGVAISLSHTSDTAIAFAAILG